MTVYSKPGCFGFVTTFNAKSMVCTDCGFKDSCKSAVDLATKALSEKVNVDAIKKLMHVESVSIARTKAAARSVEKSSSTADNKALEQILERLPAHVARVVVQLTKEKINHRKHLIEGINSMRGKKPQVLEILFDLLLAGGVSRDLFVSALKERGYTSGTASSQASIALSAVVALGIAKQEETGVFNIRGSK